MVKEETGCGADYIAQKVCAKLDLLGGYKNPQKVVPLKGPAAHEVAVGPVHAGVIEPGHFRFQCMGEDVFNLQIFLGYQHRGTEDAIVAADGNIPRQIALAETCAGDTSAAAATAFAELMEGAYPSRFPRPGDEALRVRALLIELERIANHVGDLGALAGDVAFLQAASFCGRIRGEYLNMTALVCGNRFGRNAVVPGGIRTGLSGEICSELKSRIARVRPELDRTLKLMFHEHSVCDRFDGTGKVSREIAREIGLVGVARRASEEFNGDVMARALVRRVEINEAHGKIARILDGDVPAEGGAAAVDMCDGGFVVSTATVPAWRGPLVHAAAFSPEGKMLRYKIVDPSAWNWPGLAWALRGEQISNFPICNKSFNLSYCGTDR
jgi:Ni,Fe-hydrogenase III large subunit